MMTRFVSPSYNHTLLLIFQSVPPICSVLLCRIMMIYARNKDSRLFLLHTLPIKPIDATRYLSCLILRLDAHPLIVHPRPRIRVLQIHIHFRPYPIPPPIARFKSLAVPSHASSALWSHARLRSYLPYFSLSKDTPHHHHQPCSSLRGRHLLLAHDLERLARQGRS
jgi:hypothetical protein